MGAAGLVAWSALGEKLYEYQATGALDDIVGCYALNVAADEDVWCYYYTDFPLVHLHDKRVASAWKVPVAGSHAFAVAAGHALFAGSYKDQDSFQLVRLGENGRAEKIGQFELRAGGNATVKPERTIGRGGSLYVLSEDTIYEVAISEVLAKHGG